MNRGIDLITSNLMMSFEAIIVFVFLVGGIIFMARNFKLGIVMYFLGSGGLFMWFYQAGYNWVIPLIIMLMSFVIMAFTIYFADRQAIQGGVT